MGLDPWGTLGGRNFKTKEQFKSEEKRKFGPQSERQEKLSTVLESIADRRSTKMTSVALAYVTHKTSYVFPIVGCRKASYLKDNIEALNLKLRDEEMDEIENVVLFDLAFPSNFAAGGKRPRNRQIGPGDVGLNAMYGRFDWMEDTKPIPLGLHEKLYVVTDSRACTVYTPKRNTGYLPRSFGRVKAGIAGSARRQRCEDDI
jgi:hypothetical protein